MPPLKGEGDREAVEGSGNHEAEGESPGAIRTASILATTAQIREKHSACVEK
jgi:hypothetical protein